MEYDEFLPHFVDYLESPLEDNIHFMNYLKDKINLREYADSVVLNLPKPRH